MIEIDTSKNGSTNESIDIDKESIVESYNHNLNMPTINLHKDVITTPEEFLDSFSVNDNQSNEDCIKLHSEIQKILLSYLKPVVKRDPKKKRIEIIIDLELINEEKLAYPESVVSKLETLKLNLISQISNTITGISTKVLKKGCSNTYIDYIQINTDITSK